MLSVLARNEVRIVAVLCVFQLVFFAALTLRTPFVYETTYVSDTLFMLNVAWAVFNGFDPVADFSHLYGGLLSRLLATLFWLDGVSAKAFDHALLALYLAASGLLLMVGARRLSPLSLMAALAILGALAFTRNPLENGTPSISVASHAMLYNRIGWTFAFISFLAAALEVRRGSEVLGAAAGGIAAFLMIAGKPTFALALIPIFISYFLTFRRTVLVPWAIGFMLAAIAYWITTGMGPREWLTLARYTVELGGRLSTEGLGPMKKLLLIAGANFFDIAVVLFLCALLAVRDDGKFGLPTFAVLIFLAAGTGVGVTTGAFGMHFAQIPVPAMAATVLFEIARRERQADTALCLGATLLVASFALPHMLNAASSGVKENRFPRLQVEMEGPLTNFAAEPDIAVPMRLGADRAATEERVAARLSGLRNFFQLNGQDFFLVVADGLRGLRKIDGYRDLGIISPYRRMFTFGLGAKPVVSYPFDPHFGSPDFDGLTALGAEIDVLMILRDDESAADMTDLLLRAASGDFRLESRTRFWDIYLRERR